MYFTVHTFCHTSIIAILYGEILRIIMYLKLQSFKEVILENQYENLESALTTLNILSFYQNAFLNKAKTMYKVANGLVPTCIIIDLFQSRADSLLNTSLRSVANQNFTIPKPNCSLFKEIFLILDRLYGMLFHLK